MDSGANGFPATLPRNASQPCEIHGINALLLIFLFLTKLIQFNDLDMGGGCSGGGGAVGGVRAVRAVDALEPFHGIRT